MAKKICDFCLSESKGLFNKPEKISGGHYICKNCKSIIQNYDMPLQYGIFQQLVTAPANMRSMIMDAHLEKTDAAQDLARYFPIGDLVLHDGEHCVNAIPAEQTVLESMIPSIEAVKNVADVRKATIQNVVDADTKEGAVKVKGLLVETEAGLYFMSKNYVNCHRIGYMLKGTGETHRISVVTPTKKFTYKVKHADLFYMREEFYTKVNAAIHNKDVHLIYITNDNRYRVTPGVYAIPKVLHSGDYKVKNIAGKGLHIKDKVGRIVDVPEDAAMVTLPDGGTLECTGEFELQLIEKAEQSMY